MNRKLSLTTWFVVPMILMSACASDSQQSEQVVFAPIGDGGTTVSVGMTRAELEDHVRRFADRYFTRITLATNELRDKADSEEQKRLMHDWKTISTAAIVGIAIGPNAVTNLLDMMTLTRLSRLVVDSYWIPEVLGPELGNEFLKPFVDLEEDIWSVADDVLTEQQ